MVVARSSQLLTVREVAEALGVRKATVRAWLRQRRLPRVNCGRCVRVPAKSVAAFVRRHTTPAQEDWR